MSRRLSVSGLEKGQLSEIHGGEFGRCCVVSYGTLFALF